MKTLVTPFSAQINILVVAFVAQKPYIDHR